jgi:hypothetical protein
MTIYIYSLSRTRTLILWLVDMWIQIHAQVQGSLMSSMLRDVIMVRGLRVAYYMVYGLNLFFITIIILQVDFVELS